MPDNEDRERRLLYEHLNFKPKTGVIHMDIDGEHLAFLLRDDGPNEVSIFIDELSSKVNKDVWPGEDVTECFLKLKGRQWMEDLWRKYFE